MMNSDEERYKICAQCLQESQLDYNTDSPFVLEHLEWVGLKLRAIQMAIKKGEKWVNVLMVTESGSGCDDVRLDKMLCSTCEYVLEHIVLDQKSVKIFK